MRLIDAHDLMERLYDANPKGRVELAELVETEPTVDVAKVVRCKDCKYAHMTYSGECKSCDQWVDDDDFHLTLYLDGNFYCAFGERREDETD